MNLGDLDMTEIYFAFSYFSEIGGKDIIVSWRKGKLGDGEKTVQISGFSERENELNMKTV